MEYHLHKSKELKVKFLDEFGRPNVQIFKNLAAEVLEHEINHLQGKIIDSARVKTKDAHRFNWYFKNLKNIFNKIKFFRNAPDGLIEKSVNGDDGIYIYKENNQIRMYFSHKGKLSGIMSRIELQHPLRMISLYGQAMLSSLVFVNNPKNAYVIGFGGGRIPMILHHYFPKINVDSTEIDRKVFELSRKYFGINPDERMKVSIEDGREFLENKSRSYDLIFVDVFKGSGIHPLLFSTREFYKLCKRSLNKNGVVCTYLIDTDLYFKSKCNTFIESFDNVYQFFYEGTCVLYGFDGINKYDNLNILSKIARSLDYEYGFRFSIEYISNKIEIVKNNKTETNNPYKEYGLLKDKDNFENQIDVFTKTSRNDLCPCGSGKKYKKCHMLMN